MQKYRICLIINDKMAEVSRVFQINDTLRLIYGFDI